MLKFLHCRTDEALLCLQLLSARDVLSLAACCHSLRKLIVLKASEKEEPVNNTSSLKGEMPFADKLWRMIFYNNYADSEYAVQLASNVKQFMDTPLPSIEEHREQVMKQLQIEQAENNKMGKAVQRVAKHSKVKQLQLQYLLPSVKVVYCEWLLNYLITFRLDITTRHKRFTSKSVPTLLLDEYEFVHFSVPGLEASIPAYSNRYLLNNNIVALYSWILQEYATYHCKLQKSNRLKSALTLGSFVEIKSRPCIINEIHISPPGKHGRPKIITVGSCIFTGAKYEDLDYLSMPYLLPNIEINEYCAIVAKNSEYGTVSFKVPRHGAPLLNLSAQLINKFQGKQEEAAAKGSRVFINCKQVIDGPDGIADDSAADSCTATTTIIMTLPVPETETMTGATSVTVLTCNGCSRIIKCNK